MLIFTSVMPHANVDQCDASCECWPMWRLMLIFTNVMPHANIHQCDASCQCWQGNQGSLFQQAGFPLHQHSSGFCSLGAPKWLELKHGENLCFHWSHSVVKINENYILIALNRNICNIKYLLRWHENYNSFRDSSCILLVNYAVRCCSIRMSWQIHRARNVPWNPYSLIDIKMLKNEQKKRIYGPDMVGCMHVFAGFLAGSKMVWCPLA